jgi:hypothetical protein
VNKSEAKAKAEQAASKIKKMLVEIWPDTLAGMLGEDGYEYDGSISIDWFDAVKLNFSCFVPGKKDDWYWHDSDQWSVRCTVSPKYHHLHVRASSYTINSNGELNLKGVLSRCKKLYEIFKPKIEEEKERERKIEERRELARKEVGDIMDDNRFHVSINGDMYNLNLYGRYTAKQIRQIYDVINGIK